MQEKIMRVPYGEKKEYFKYSLFIVFCNRLMTSAVSAGALLVRYLRSIRFLPEIIGSFINHRHIISFFVVSFRRVKRH